MIEADFETRSDIDIRTHGAYVYFESPNARVLLGSFKQGGNRFRWRFGQPCPAPLREHVETGGMIAAHNASFEALCFRWLHDNCGWPLPRPEQFRCTAATAAAMQLPRSLGDLGEALGLAIKKDKEGMRLIRKFSIPQKGGAFIEPEQDAEDFERFHAYCDIDVETEAEADRRMVPLSDYEQAVYVLSEKINNRGVRIDVTSARAALQIAAKAKVQLDAMMAKATAGAVRKCSEVAKLTAWIEAQGVAVESLGKADIDDLLEFDDLPGHVRHALEIRQEAAKTSVSKIKAMLDRASRDGRVRGTFMYHGAGTGRWTNMGVNFANMPRPRKSYEGLRQDQVFEAIRTGDPDYLRFAYGPDIGRPLHLISDAVRGFIMAAPGHDLVQADYSNIEGVVVAWLAGETWKLEAFREVFADPNNVPDLYRRTAAGILGLPREEVTKKHWARQGVGKPAELACIAEGELVLTEDGLVPIEQVSTSSRVWDGVEWVRHDGPILRGYKETIAYAGLCATPDHIVFTEDGQQVPFGTCASQQIPLAQTGLGWQAIRARFSDERGSDLARGLAVSANAMCDVRHRKADLHGQSAEGQDAGLPEVQPTQARAGLAAEAVGSRTSEMHEPPRSGLPELRGPGRGMAFQVGPASGALASTELHGQPRFGSGPGGQHRALRAGEHPHGSAPCEPEQPSQHDTDRHRGPEGSVERCLPPVSVPPPEGCLRGHDAGAAAGARLLGSGDCRAVEHAVVQAKRPVWDLLNAGPRNRFTVSGRLVHNCGYQGGVSAFYTFARAAGVKLPDIAPAVLASASEEALEKARKRYEANFKRNQSRARELGQDAWVACEIIKNGWRTQNAAIAQSWHDLENAAREAVENPGTISEAAKTQYIVRFGYLWARLPSGRCLCYGAPRLKEQVWAKMLLEDGSWSDAEVMERDAAERGSVKGTVKIEGNTSDKVTVMGVDAVTKKWRRYGLYGGLLCENNTQAVARDLLVNGLFKAEAAGYPVIAHVYDEIIAEVPRGFGSVADFERIICELPGWAEGLPLTAGGWRGKRYRKD